MHIADYKTAMPKRSLSLASADHSFWPPCAAEVSIRVPGIDAADQT
jgi:hypothetical protein